MAGLNYEEKISFSTTIKEFMEQNKEEFKNLGLDLAHRMTRQGELNSTYVSEDAKQEKMKAEVVKQTEITVGALDETYVYASSSLDAMAGVLGKDSPLAKRLHKLRPQMSHKSSEKE